MVKFVILDIILIGYFIVEQFITQAASWTLEAGYICKHADRHKDITYPKARKYLAVYRTLGSDVGHPGSDSHSQENPLGTSDHLTEPHLL